MIDSQQLIQQFTSGTISVASVESLFHAHGRREGDVVYLQPEITEVSQVVIALSTEPSGSQEPRSVQIDFKQPYQVSLDTLTTAACSHWTRSPLGRAETSYQYFCLVNHGGHRLNVTADLTGEIGATATRVKELSFTR